NIKKYFFPGPTKFFKTVANYQDSSSKIFVPQMQGTNKEMNTEIDCEYWDFGTSKRYADSMFRLLRLLSGMNVTIKTSPPYSPSHPPFTNQSYFIDFCLHNKVFDINKKNIKFNLSYGSTDKDNTINLCHTFFSNKQYQNQKILYENIIITKDELGERGNIYYKNIVDTF
ncbi:MAG: hypothetical protein HQK51_07295, partial [Oligoflexia bacterium]|nr:hypothetical protein [Oligoflexia bacterium]